MAAGRSAGAGEGGGDGSSLRVSVASLVRVVFDGSGASGTQLALERTATVLDRDAGEVRVVAKPFGGGVRLTDPQALRQAIGSFRFDSKRSRQEQDFRLQVPPAAWHRVMEICREHLSGEPRILDPSPDRELAEEFDDTVGITLRPDEYRLAPLGMRVQEAARPTESVRASGQPTVRVYYLFAAHVQDPGVVAAMLESSRQISDRDLASAALAQAQRGGRGRANAVLALGLDALREAYLDVPASRRAAPRSVAGHRLSGNVPVILEGVALPGFRSYAAPGA